MATHPRLRARHGGKGRPSRGALAGVAALFPLGILAVPRPSQRAAQQETRSRRADLAGARGAGGQGLVFLCGEPRGARRQRCRSWLRPPSAAARAGSLEGAWAVFDLPVTADKQEIRRRYRELVAEEHPDKWPNDPDAPERFKRITEAYRDLMERRATSIDDLEGVNLGEGDVFRDLRGIDSFGDFFEDKPGGAGAGEADDRVEAYAVASAVNDGFATAAAPVPAVARTAAEIPWAGRPGERRRTFRAPAWDEDRARRSWANAKGKQEPWMQDIVTDVQLFLAISSLILTSGALHCQSSVEVWCPDM